MNDDYNDERGDWESDQWLDEKLAASHLRDAEIKIKQLQKDLAIYEGTLLAIANNGGSMRGIWSQDLAMQALSIVAPIRTKP